MALIHDLQAELLDEEKSVGFVLLKLKYLASKLGADFLDDWVQHEVGGYPPDVPVPNYREASITYTGTFVNVAQQLSNVPIPTYLVEEHAGKNWTKFEIRSSLSLIDQRMKEKGDSKFGIDCSNLPLLLRNKIYDGMAIVEINSDIDIGSFLNIQHNVRARALDFVLKLEKEIPSVVDIRVGGKITNVSAAQLETVTHLTQQIIHGGVTNISANGGEVNFQVNVIKGDAASLIDALVAKGIAEKDAKELAELAQAEPSKFDEQATEKWLQGKIKDGAVAAWNIGTDIVKEVITAALKDFFGL